MKRTPFVIGIAGSVAVGKSTSWLVCYGSSWDVPRRPVVDLVTTDGFLYPNRVLEERELFSAKGFLDLRPARLLRNFVVDVKSGMPEVTAPGFTHVTYTTWYPTSLVR